MQVEVQLAIAASRERLWAAITDIDHCAAWIEGIRSVEVLERPESGLVGLRWRETRVMFGKEATEVMWITDVEPGRRYQTRAESHGSIYVSWLAIDGEDGALTLRMGFQGEAQSTAAKVMTVALGWMMKGATEKALMQDLRDIKAHVEANRAVGT